MTGVLADGDTKFPDAAHLLSPKIHAQLAWTSVQYGVSAVGGLALALLVLRRRFDRVDAVLLGTVAIGLYVSLRYSYHHRIGPHYHVFAALLGAWCVARAWPARAGPLVWALFGVAVVAQGAWRFSFEREWRARVVATPQMEVAASIRALTRPGDLVVVREPRPAVDPEWQRRTNYENPSLFYQSGRRGWVLPADGFDVAALDDLLQRGARLGVDQLPDDHVAEVDRWLDEHGDAVLDLHGARVHRLRSAP